MQFNLVNDQEQVAQFAWRGVAWRSVRVYQYFGGVSAAFFSVCVLFACGAFLGGLLAVLAVSGSFAYFVCVCACPHGFAWLSVQCVGARVLSSISPPSSPYSGESGPLLYSFFH